MASRTPLRRHLAARCPECLPGVLCLTCGMAQGRTRIEDRAVWEDDEVETPAARRFDGERVRREKLAPINRCGLCFEPSQDCTCPPLAEVLR